MHLLSRAALRERPLQTGRLSLGPVEPTDGPEFWLAVDGSRQHLGRWLPWVPYQSEPASSARFVEACCADWDNGYALRFAVRDRASRTLFGVVGLEACSPLHRSCELGYWLRREATGRGLMTEAAGAIVDLALSALGMNRVRVAAATDNHASLRVITRLGFRFEGIARQAEWCDGRWLDHAVFGRLASDAA